MTNNKLILCGVVAFVLAFAGTASADDYNGDILLGSPPAGLGTGTTELAAPCDDQSDLNGTDGVWFDIGDDDGTSFTLTMDATLDADVYFYDAECDYISDTVGGQAGLGADESGAVPSDATYAIVVGYLGTGSFTLSLA